MKGTIAALLVSAFLPIAPTGEKDATMVRATGWFVDEWCAPARLKSKPLRPTNRECAQRCIAEGAKVVFLDEASQQVLSVANAELAKDQESHYVRVVGSVDAASRTLHVKSVAVLEEYSASCALPRPKAQ